MVDKALKAILLLSPLFYVRDIPINNCDFFFFHFSVIALVIACMFDVPKRKMVGKKMIAYGLGLCLYSVMTHKFMPIVSNYAINATLAVLALIIIVQYCTDYRSCYKYIVLAGLINIAIYLFQRVGFSPILQIGDATSMGAIIGNRPRFVMYLCLLIPYFYNVSKLAMIPLFIVTALVAPNEFSLMLAFLLFFLMSGADIRYKLVAVGALAIAVAVFHRHAMMALQFRQVVFGQSLVNFFNAPMYGLGLGVYPLGLEQMTTSKVDYTIYNSFLQFIVCGGLLTIPLLIEGFKKFIKHFRNDVPCKVISILLLLGLYEYPLEITRLWITIIATAGFFVIQSLENRSIHYETEDIFQCVY
jgi:hypothetical protein